MSTHSAFRVISAFLLLLCVFIGRIFAQASGPVVSTISEKSGELIYRIEFPNAVPQFDNNGRILSWDFPGSECDASGDLPIYTYLLELPTQSSVASIVDSRSERIIKRAVGIPASLYPAVSISFAGYMREIPLHRLIVRPLISDGAGVTLYRALTVKITYKATRPVSITENPAEIDQLLRSVSLNADFARRSRILTAKKSENTNSKFLNLPTQRFRLEVDSNAIYKVTFEDLQKTGIDPATIDPSTFAMFNLGLSVPIYVRTAHANRFSPGDFVEFFGEKYTASKNPALKDLPALTRHFLDPWTTTNVYFLSWGEKAGLRLIEENAGVILPGKRDSLSSIQFAKTVHYEEDNTRISFKDINVNQPSALEDIWFYDNGISNLISQQSQKTYAFNLTGLSSFSNGQILRVNLQGISPSTHSVDIKINDLAVTTTLSWSGITKFQTDIPIPIPGANILREGSNTLTISTPVTANPTQLQLQTLNWFEILYKHRYRAVNNAITFTVGDQSPTLLKQFKVDGFTDPDISIYKKGVSRLVNFDLKADPGNQGVTTYFIDFQDEVQSGQSPEYVAVSESAKLKPRLTLQTQSSLRSGFHNARYVVIVPRSLSQTAQRLVSHRQANGLAAEIVLLEDLYDEFNFGVKSPYAIRNFLRFTYNAPNWQGTQGPPLYVLLIGDASINARKSAFDVIPTQHIQTKSYGPAASDHWFSLLTDNDLLPDFFVGRIPCSTPGQLDAFIDKVINYESQPLSGDWKNKVTFVGGQRDDRGVQQNNSNIPTDVFRFQTTNLINNRLQSAFTPERIYVYPIRDQFYGNFQNVIRRFDEGSLLINYLGHGGGGIWGDLDSITGKPLLNLTQVTELSPNNARLPLILSMTCFVGAFDDDSRQSLGEALLLTPGRGALGLLASSGTGWIIADYTMLEQSLEPFLTRGLTVGQALALGKTGYLLQQGASDIEVSGGGGGLGLSEIPQSMAYQFNYFGDPALKLKIPEVGTMNLSAYSPSSTGTMTVTATAPFPTGSGRAEIFQLKTVKDSVLNGANKPSYVNLDTIDFSVSNSAISFDVNLGTIPGLLGGKADIRIFAESPDGTTAFHTSKSFSVDATFLSEPFATPSKPTGSDSVYFHVTADDPQGIASAELRLTRIGAITQTLTEPMFSSSNQVWRSRGLGPFPENELLIAQVKTTDGVGDTSLSATSEIRIRSAVDLGLASVTNPGSSTNAIFLGNGQYSRLSAAVMNNGFRTVPSAKINFYNGDPRSGGVLLGTIIASIGGASSDSTPAIDTVAIVSTLGPGTFPVYVWLDPDSLLTDSDRNNNLGFRFITVNSFNVTPALGTTVSGASTDTVFIDAGMNVVIPPSGVPAASSISFVKTSGILLDNQPDLQFASPLGTGSPAGYRISLNSSVSPSFPARIAFQYDTTAYAAPYQDSISIYKWSSGNRRWTILKESVTRTNGVIRASVSGELSGLYTILINRDRQPPSIESTVEGQFFVQGALAPKEAKIAAIVTDRNGVSLVSSDYDIRINGEIVPNNQIILPDSLANSNTVTLTLKPDAEFSVGNNLVTFRATDVNGNVSATDTLSFRVVSTFNIELIGNFPNPFANTTVFAYRIEAGEPLDDIELSIYTVSGRRIKKIGVADVGREAINAVGYHEIQWDATDDRGHTIANGIYFYMLKGRLNGKTVRKKGKLAYFR